ncbi:MAG: aldo/keto reductase [Bacteroidota bacterium]
MTLLEVLPDNKILVLGTALWGWGVDRSTAFHMLDRFLQLGGRIVDTATNYPINKRPDDFGIVIKWISEWIASNGTKELSVLVKFGATDNMGGRAVNLGSSFISETEAFLRKCFGTSLAGMAVHWDNRGNGEYDASFIAETVYTMSKLQSAGLSIGFSGVSRPDLYLSSAPELSDKWWIQIKENALSSTARLEYQKFFPKSTYLAYGINMGGMKLDPPADNSSLVLRGINYQNELIKWLSKFINSNHGLNPAPKNLNELALFSSYLNPSLRGVVIGPRNMVQLESTICFWNRLRSEASPSMVSIFPKYPISIE